MTVRGVCLYADEFSATFYVRKFPFIHNQWLFHRTHIELNLTPPKIHFTFSRKYGTINFNFTSLEAVICGDKIILEGTEYAVGEDGYVVAASSGMHVGTMGENGKIDKFENIEFVY